MGVWIETKDGVQYDKLLEVTPCMGVWIETATDTTNAATTASHPVWVCGLKLVMRLMLAIVTSHTLYGCVD